MTAASRWRCSRMSLCPDRIQARRRNVVPAGQASVDKTEKPRIAGIRPSRYSDTVETEDSLYRKSLGGGESGRAVVLTTDCWVTGKTWFAQRGEITVTSAGNMALIEQWLA